MNDKKTVTYTIYPEHRNRQVLSITQKDLKKLFPNIESDKESIRAKGKLYGFNGHFGEYERLLVHRLEEGIYQITRDGMDLEPNKEKESQRIVESTFPSATKIEVKTLGKSYNPRKNYQIVIDE
ncbi:MAG: hypothetical protein GOU98_01760 [Candidatus Altiarchaeota archaeon]|nr:hypothetical protein [Candidatus Altiarchaeota archaeon]